MPRPTKPRSRSRSRQPVAARKSDALPLRSKDALLQNCVDDVIGDNVLCLSLSRGALAGSLAERWPKAEVSCFFLDTFLAQQAQAELGEKSRVAIHCDSDFPPGPFHTVVLPFLKNGDAELTRELLQQGHERLEIGGRLLVSTDNPRDHWLHDQLQTLFGKVTKQPQPTGVVYVATKTETLRRVRDFTCEFAFRDGERLIKAVSRPGVFSHRELDVGARALLEATAREDAVQPGARVLDLGCGAGTVGLALALRQPHVHVHAVDSNPRALECTSRGATLNGLKVVAKCPPAKSASRLAASSAASDGGSPEPGSTVSVQLDADGKIPHPGSFDVVVANPPYYSNWAIATIFVEAAARALKPHGRLFLVTKHAEWYQTNLPFVLSDVQVQTIRSYAVVTARPRR